MTTSFIQIDYEMLINGKEAFGECKILRYEIQTPLRMDDRGKMN